MLLGPKKYPVWIRVNHTCHGDTFSIRNPEDGISLQICIEIKSLVAIELCYVNHVVLFLKAVFFQSDKIRANEHMNLRHKYMKNIRRA